MESAMEVEPPPIIAAQPQVSVPNSGGPIGTDASKVQSTMSAAVVPSQQPAIQPATTNSSQGGSIQPVPAPPGVASAAASTPPQPSSGTAVAPLYTKSAEAVKNSSQQSGVGGFPAIAAAPAVKQSVLDAWAQQIPSIAASKPPVTLPNPSVTPMHPPVSLANLPPPVPRSSLEKRGWLPPPPVLQAASNPRGVTAPNQPFRFPKVPIVPNPSQEAAVPSKRGRPRKEKPAAGTPPVVETAYLGGANLGWPATEQPPPPAPLPQLGVVKENATRGGATAQATLPPQQVPPAQATLPPQQIPAAHATPQQQSTLPNVLFAEWYIQRLGWLANALMNRPRPKEEVRDIPCGIFLTALENDGILRVQNDLNLKSFSHVVGAVGSGTLLDDILRSHTAIVVDMLQRQETERKEALELLTRSQEKIALLEMELRTVSYRLSSEQDVTKRLMNALRTIQAAGLTPAQQSALGGLSNLFANPIENPATLKRGREIQMPGLAGMTGVVEIVDLDPDLAPAKRGPGRPRRDEIIPRRNLGRMGGHPPPPAVPTGSSAAPTGIPAAPPGSSAAPIGTSPAPTSSSAAPTGDSVTPALPNPSPNVTVTPSPNPDPTPQTLSAPSTAPLANRPTVPSSAPAGAPPAAVPLVPQPAVVPAATSPAVMPPAAQPAVVPLMPVVTAPLVATSTVAMTSVPSAINPGALVPSVSATAPTVQTNPGPPQSMHSQPQDPPSLAPPAEGLLNLPATLPLFKPVAPSITSLALAKIAPAPAFTGPVHMGTAGPNHNGSSRSVHTSGARPVYTNNMGPVHMGGLGHVHTSGSAPLHTASAGPVHTCGAGTFPIGSTGPIHTSAYTGGAPPAFEIPERTSVALSNGRGPKMTSFFPLPEILTAEEAARRAALPPFFAVPEKTSVEEANRSVVPAPLSEEALQALRGGFVLPERVSLSVLERGKSEGGSGKTGGEEGRSKNDDAETREALSDAETARVDGVSTGGVSTVAVNTGGVNSGSAGPDATNKDASGGERSQREEGSKDGDVEMTEATGHAADDVIIGEVDVAAAAQDVTVGGGEAGTGNAAEDVPAVELERPAMEQPGELASSVGKASGAVQTGHRAVPTGQGAVPTGQEQPSAQGQGEERASLSGEKAEERGGDGGAANKASVLGVGQDQAGAEKAEALPLDGVLPGAGGEGVGNGTGGGEGQKEGEKSPVRSPGQKSEAQQTPLRRSGRHK